MSSFFKNISSVSIEKLNILFDDAYVLNFKEKLKTNNIFVLGETHGVKENIDVIYTLFSIFGFRTLALEWPSDLKDLLSKFIETEVLDFEKIKDCADGRITAEHFALITKLKNEKLLDEVICFDGQQKENDWNMRDKIMAQNIIGSISYSPILIMTGNLHARTESFVYKNNPEQIYPLGKHIKTKFPDALFGKIEYMEGSYHNFGIKNFDKVDTKNTKATFYKDAHSFYIFELPKVHAATVPNPDKII